MHKQLVCCINSTAAPADGRAAALAQVQLPELSARAAAPQPGATASEQPAVSAPAPAAAWVNPFAGAQASRRASNASGGRRSSLGDIFGGDGGDGNGSGGDGSGGGGSGGGGRSATNSTTSTRSIAEAEAAAKVCFIPAWCGQLIWIFCLVASLCGTVNRRAACM